MHSVAYIIVNVCGWFLVCTFLCRFLADTMYVFDHQDNVLMRLYAIVGTSLTNSQYYENVIVSMC